MAWGLLLFAFFFFEENQRAFVWAYKQRVVHTWKVKRKILSSKQLLGSFTTKKKKKEKKSDFL